ncbi:sodium:solute symporter family protein [Virgibacillus sp. NKC19-3]|uniref:sodium:solute symporter family protein n=1 Tax=Virgibacillus saliphilus TaxID=2831674 RepID=UPI001C9A36FE|nr:sodium:solute symporter family protein [Virgibacillus sp. NKC19-3]MBY7144502.1 sodium:solute symporter family protein [Virgibacillus sp. NKC19-3]
MNVFAIGLIIYLIVLLAIGYISAKNIKSSDHYLVANRSLGIIVLVGTIVAGWLGAGTVVGHASISYSNGYGALWWVAGGVIGILIIITIATRLRQLEMYTVPDLLELRYGPTARILGSITIIIAFTGIVGSQMKAVAYVLDVVVDFNGDLAIFIGASIVVIYTVMGGMYSVAYTDLVQYGLLIIGLIIAAPIAFSSAGGFSGWETSLPTTHFEPTGGLGFFGALAVGLPFLMLATVDQNLYQRMYSAKDSRTAKKGAIWGLFGGALVMLLVFVIAVSSAVLFPNINPDLAVYAIATDLLNPFLGMILLIAVLSIILSTADSYLLSPATNIVKDIYVRFINPSTSDQQILRLTRICVVLLGVVALSGALWFDTFLEFMLVGYTIYGAGVFFPILAAFFWKGATNKGALAAIAGGLVSTLTWEFGIPSSIPTIYIGGVLSLALLVIVSLFTKHSDTENANAFKKKKDDEAAPINKNAI